MNAHWLRSLIVVLTLQAALPGADALALGARRGEAIEVRGGRLTAVIVESPFPTLLQAIARQGGVEIFLHASLEGTVTVTFRDVPLEEALRRILRTTNAVFIYSQPSSARAGAPQARLTEVHVYPGSTTTATPVPGVVLGAETPMASETTKTQLTAEATKDLLGAELRVSRKYAAQTLGRLGDLNAIGPLSQTLLQDEDATVRLSAIKALGALRSEQAVGPLAGVLLADPDLEVREATANALGKTWSTMAVAPLTQALQQDSSALVREAAARALGRTWNEAAVDPLVQALTSDANPRVRESAARALGVIDDSRAASAVAKTLSDAHPWVREQAAAVLAVLGKR